MLVATPWKINGWFSQEWEVDGSDDFPLQMGDLR